MLIQIIVTLLLAGRVISSVSVQGSISIVNNDTMTIYLHTGKSSDGLDKLFRKLHEAKSNPRLHLAVYLGEKIVVVEGKLENYLKSDKTTWRNNIEATDAINYRISAGRFALNENDYKTLYSNDVARITTPRLRDVKKLVVGIDNILRPIIVILEQRDDKMSYRNFRQIYSPILEYPFVADLLFENERSESNRELEMFLDYAKSVQDHLSSLTKALDAKWRQSRDQLNESLRRRLVTLQKQAQFLLNSLPERKRSKKKSGKKYRASSKKSTSNVTNFNATELKKSVTSDTEREDEEKNEEKTIDEIIIKEKSNGTASLSVHRDLTNGSRDGSKIERTTILNEDDKENVKALPLNETAVNANSFREVHNKTQRKSKNETKDESVLQARTRFLNYPKSTRKFNYDYANTVATINTFYGLKNNTVKNNTVIDNVTEVTKSRNFVPKIGFVDQRTFTKTEEFTKFSHGDDANKLKTQTNLFNQMANNSAFLPTSENIITPSVLRKTDEENRSKGAITTVKVAEKFMNHSLGINNNRNHALAKKIAGNYHFKTNAQNKTLAIMDEILKAFEQVLP